MNKIEILSEAKVKFRELKGGDMFRFSGDCQTYMRLQYYDEVCFARLDDGVLFRFNGTITADQYLEKEVTPIRSITISLGP